MATHALVRMRGFWPRRVTPKDWHTEHHVKKHAHVQPMALSSLCADGALGKAKQETERNQSTWDDRRRVAQRLMHTLMADDLRAELAGGPTLHSQGPVHRHAARGVPVHNPRERRRQEDAECRAGMRDAAKLAETWPQLWDAMGPVGQVIARARSQDADLQGLRGALGADPCRAPPAEGTLRRLRVQVA